MTTVTHEHRTNQIQFTFRTASKKIGMFSKIILFLIQATHQIRTNVQIPVMQLLCTIKASNNITDFVMDSHQFTKMPNFRQNNLLAILSLNTTI